jgi:hypothetical protein
MALINQWKDVTSLECNQVGNATCFQTGNDIIAYYGFDKVRRKKYFNLFVLY